MNMRKSYGRRKPYKIRRKKSLLKNRFLRPAVLMLIIFFGIFYLICFYPIFQIKKIIITGEEKVLTRDIENIVEREIEKKILFFSSKSVFLLKPSKIEKAILNNFPEISGVKIKRGVSVLDIIVIERVGVASWCQEQECFLIDEKGIAFKKKDGDGPQPFLKIRVSNQTNDEKLGKKVIEKEKLSQILEIETKLKENSKIPLEEILIISNTRLDAKTREGWQVFFNPEEDIDWQLTKLDLVLKQEIPLEQRKNLEYIDLRFSRVYYRYKE